MGGFDQIKNRLKSTGRWSEGGISYFDASLTNIVITIVVFSGIKNLYFDFSLLNIFIIPFQFLTLLNARSLKSLIVMFRILFLIVQSYMFCCRVDG